MNLPEDKSKNLESIVLKSNVKQKVYQNTLYSFNLLKEALRELVDEYSVLLKDRISGESLPTFHEKGLFEAEFRLAADMLLFSMHSNVFVFNREHPVWKVDYIKNDPLNSYCGIIHIYNFQIGRAHV